MQFPLILVVDDDPVVTRTLCLNLQTDGYDVVTASSGREALRLLDKRLPALAIVDLLLPDIHGFDLSRKIKSYGDIPILVLTAVGTVESIVQGLEESADDYVVKPYRYAELRARIGRILKRARSTSPATDVVPISAEVHADFARHVVTVAGREVKLTRTETRSLVFLFRHANQAVPTETLVREIWEDGEGDENRLWVLIKRLRDKIELDPSNPHLLLNERGVGYRLVVGMQ